MVAYAINELRWDNIRHNSSIVKKRSKTCYTAEQVMSMLEFFIDIIFAEFGGSVFKQIVEIKYLWGTNCSHLLADLFLFSYESDFLQTLVTKKKTKEARLFNFAFRYILMVFFPLTFQKQPDCVPFIHPAELEIEETTDTASVFSFELFYIVLSGPFIADYAVWALLIVEGRTVTYSC